MVRGSAALLAALFVSMAVAVIGTPAQADTTSTPAKIVFTTSPASATGGTAFGTQPQVTVEDSSGHAVTGDASTVTLTLNAPTSGGPGTLSGCTQTEDSGVVSFSGCAVDLIGSGYTLTATDGTFTATSDPFDVKVGPVAKVAFTVQPSSITAGTAFSPAPTLTVEDAGGNVVTSSTDAVGLGVLAGPDTSGILSCTGGETAAPKDKAPGYKLTVSNGTATFSGCTINQAASANYTLVAAASDGTSAGTFSTQSNPFAVSSGAATQLVFTTDPAGALAGGTFGTQPVVAVEDAAGNVVPSVNGTISLSLTPNTGASGANLSCTPTATVNGVATFTDCSLDTVGSGYTLSATISSSSLTGTSTQFDVTSNAAAALTFTSTPDSATGGAAFSKQPVVTVNDAGGNPVSGSVKLGLQGGPSGAHLTCDVNPMPAGAGTATFTGCSVDLAGTYHLVATEPGASGVPQTVSDAFTVSTGPAAQVVFTTSPKDAVGGNIFPTQPVVSVQDLGGNPVPNSSVDLSITPDTRLAGDVLVCKGGTSMSAPTGNAAFTGCRINAAGTGYTLTATSGSLIATSSAFSVATGAPSRLAFSVQPSGGMVSGPFGGQPRVIVTDNGGNPIADSGVPVTLSISGGNVGCLSNPVSTDGAGAAQFALCGGNSTGTLTLHATAPGLAAANSSPFTLSSGTTLTAAPTGLPVAQTFGGTDLGSNPTSTTDDVNSATGALQLALPDLTMAGIGEPFTLNRDYNSSDTTGGSFGSGWSSIFDAGVQVSAGGHTAVVRNEDGQQLTYTSNGQGGWTAPPGAHATLNCAGVLCTVTRFDGVTFQSVGGRIQDYLSRNGNGLHFIYSGNRLVQVTGSAQGLVSGVQASLGEQVGSQGWTAGNTGSSDDLNAIALLDPSHAWAAGSNCAVEMTTDGKTWTKDTNVSGCSAGTSLTAITVHGGAGPAWAAGSGGTVLVCDPCKSATAKWSAVSGGLPGDLSIRSIWASDPNTVYLTGTTSSGAGEIWACSAQCSPHGSGSPTWVNVTPSGLESTGLNGITGQGNALVIAVGAHGAVLLCSGPSCATSSSQWTALSQGNGGALPSSDVTFKSVWIADPNHIFVAGDKSGNGVLWSCSARCKQSVTGPSTVPSPPGGAAPAGTAAAWANITPPGLTTALTSVTSAGPDRAWATGSNGQIWYCPANCATEPSGWVALSAPWTAAGPLAAIDAFNPNSVWAAGKSGLVLTSTGPTPTLNTLDHAIATLGVALNQNLWTDGNTLSSTLGDTVTANVAFVTQLLSTITSPQSQPAYSGWVTSGMLDLNRAMRVIDANAISENMNAPANASALGSAETSFAGADAKLTAAQFPAAANLYRAAWAQANAAKGTGQGSHVPLRIGITENGNGNVTQVSTPTRTVNYTYTGTALTGYTDANGNTWTYSYDTTGSTPRLAQMIDPAGQVRLAVTYAGSRVKTAKAMGSQSRFADSYTWDASNGASIRMQSVQTAANATPTTAEYVDQYKNNALVSQQFPSGATLSYSYDSALNLLASQDPLGRIQAMAYDAAGDLTSQTNAVGTNAQSVSKMTYTAAHQIASATDADGNTTTYSYAGGNLVKVTPPGSDAGAIRFQFNYLGEQTEVDSPTGIETYTYDDAGNQTNFQDLDLQRNQLNGLGPVYTYNEAGEKLVSTDSRGHSASGLDPAFQSTNRYDADGNLLSTTDPSGQASTTTYNAAGDVTSTTDPAGHKTTQSWDESTLTLTTSSAGGTSTATYDPTGTVLSKTDAGGRTTSYTYDLAGRELSETDPANITTSYKYDVGGNVVAASDSVGHASTFVYDAQNRLVRSTVNGVTTQTGYDPAGNVTSQTDGAGRVTKYAYNSHSLLSSVTTAAGTTSYGYDLGDNLTSVTDGDGHTTSYQVDGAGHRTAMTVNGNVTKYAYDVAGNLVSTTDPDGRTTRYTLNAEDLRTEINYSQPGQASIDITQTFNALGQRTSMTDPTTGTHTYAYDASGNLTEIDTAGAATFKYDYSVPGQMTETYPDGTKVTYTFDDAHNVMSVSSGPVQVSYVRNPARQITGIAYSNGVLQTQQYDKAGRLTGYALSCGASTELTSAVAVDASGVPVGQATTVGSNTTVSQFGYDGAGRVVAQNTSTSTAVNPTTPGAACTSGTPSSPGSPQQNDGSGTTTDTTPVTTVNQPALNMGTAPSQGTNANPVGYDAVGNQTSANGTTTSYNAADEVTSGNGASYTYDNAGNVTSVTANGATTQYAYNTADQLVTVTEGSKTITYTYDGDGNRVSKTVNGPSGTSTTEYTWDPSGNVPLLVLETADAGSLIARFIYGVGPVAMQTPAGTYYLHTDGIGSVTAMTDSTGAMLASYSYDAFGNVTVSQVGTTAPPDEPILFQGQYLDPSTGLYDMRARNYDPATGRFTQPDPATSTTVVGNPVFSRYVFANDQPTFSSDPTGQLSASEAESSIEDGHSTESANQANLDKYGATATKVGVTAGAKYAQYVAKTKAASAALKLATVGTRGSGAAAEAALDAEKGASASKWASYLDKAGKLLTAVGIGLAAYVTYEDCAYGTVQQCVGDSIGLAFSVGCLAISSGAGSFACAMVGLAISEVVSMYGPEIVTGLIDVGQYISDGATVAINAIEEGYSEVAATLSSAYATAATEVSSFVNVAGAGLTYAFNVVATGFNEQIAAIASGFDSAMSTLEQAGLSALQMAAVLKDEFQEGVNSAINQLVTLGYDIDGIATALSDTFNETIQQTAVILHAFEYGYTEIAAGLLSAYSATAQLAATVLRDIGADITTITNALKTVYAETAEAMATVLSALNYTVQQIAGIMNSIYTLADKATAEILQGLKYSYDQIAGALSNVYNDAAADVATVLYSLSATASEIASTLRDTFTIGAKEVADLLQNTVGVAIDEVGTALEEAYGETASAVASVLNSIGDTASEISGVLQDVFESSISDVEGVLSDIGLSSATIAAIGGAFTSFGDDVEEWADDAFSWL